MKSNTNIHRAVLLILFAALLIVEAIFVWQNDAEVPVRVLFWEGISYTGMLIFISIAIGIITAVILLLPGIVQRKKELQEASKHVESLQEKLSEYKKGFRSKDELSAESKKNQKTELPT